MVLPVDRGNCSIWGLIPTVKHLFSLSSHFPHLSSRLVGRYLLFFIFSCSPTTCVFSNFWKKPYWLHSFRSSRFELGTIFLLANCANHRTTKQPWQLVLTRIWSKSFFLCHDRISSLSITNSAFCGCKAAACLFVCNTRLWLLTSSVQDQVSGHRCLNLLHVSEECVQDKGCGSLH